MFFLLFNIVFNLKLNFMLKIDPKMRTFKNLDEIRKTLKIFGKNKWQLCKIMYCQLLRLNIFFKQKE